LLSSFPAQWPARIEVVTSSGLHERAVTHVPGDPARPLDAAAVREKFRRCAEPAVGANAAVQLLERALGLLDGQAAAAQMLQDIGQSIDHAGSSLGAEKK